MVSIHVHNQLEILLDIIGRCLRDELGVVILEA